MTGWGMGPLEQIGPALLEGWNPTAWESSARVLRTSIDKWLRCAPCSRDRRCSKSKREHVRELRRSLSHAWSAPDTGSQDARPRPGFEDTSPIDHRRLLEREEGHERRDQ